MAKDIPAMVQGLGMATRLISTLSAEIKALGGNDEMLHFLTTENGRENMKAVAKFIIGLRYRIPMSEIMALAKASSIKENGRESPHVASDEAFFWTTVLQDLKIPYRRFVADNSQDPADCALSEIAEQIDGKRAEPGMLLSYKGSTYMICYIGYDAGDPQVGDIIRVKKVSMVCLVSADRIAATHNIHSI